MQVAQQQSNHFAGGSALSIADSPNHSVHSSDTVRLTDQLESKKFSYIQANPVNSSARAQSPCIHFRHGQINLLAVKLFSSHLTVR